MTRTAVGLDEATNPYDPLILALDLPAPATALSLAERVVGRVGMVKVSPGLFAQGGWISSGPWGGWGCRFSWT